MIIGASTPPPSQMLRLTIGCLNGVTERLLVTVFYNFVVFLGGREGSAFPINKCLANKNFYVAVLNSFLLRANSWGGKREPMGP
jgi:hypothetical protein